MPGNQCLAGVNRTDAQIAADKLRTGRPKRHGKWMTPTWRSWRCMWSRATHPHKPLYEGITVCIPWIKFEAFLEDMGERPEGTSLDRISGDYGYSPENCRWATIFEQNQNRRSKGGRKKRS